MKWSARILAGILLTAVLALPQPVPPALATSGTTIWWSTDTFICPGSPCFLALQAFAWTTSQSVKEPVMLSVLQTSDVATPCYANWFEDDAVGSQIGSSWYANAFMSTTGYFCTNQATGWRFSWSRSS